MADLGSSLPGMGHGGVVSRAPMRARGVLPGPVGMFRPALLSLLLSSAPVLALGPEPQAAARPSPVPTRTIVGSIVSVNASRGTVVVRESVTTRKNGTPAPAETATVLVGESTQVVKGKRAATIADLRPGDHVVLRYAGTGGSGLALSLRVAETAPPAPSASPATPAPPPAAPAPRG